jgi:hypothetical protein
VSWRIVEIINCMVCGRPITRRAWQFSDPDHGTLRACEPSCEDLWFSYLRDRARPPERVSPHD